MTDRELIERYVRGERREEAFRELVERYGGMVQLACERQLRDRQLAEDAMQGVFVLLSEKAGTVREGKLAGWLLGVARFACAKVGRERMRRERRERSVVVEERRSEVVVVEARGEMREMLDAGLMTLGSGDREAVAMRYLGERQLSEVGEAMGISEEAARKRVTRGVEKLRKYFARGGMVAGAGVVAEVLAAEGAKGAEVHLSVSEKVMSAWRGGATEATRAGQIAKGTKVMMKMARIKMVGGVAAAVMGVMVAGAGGWFTTEALAAHGRAAGVPTVMVAASAPAAWGDDAGGGGSYDAEEGAGDVVRGDGGGGSREDVCVHDDGSETGADAAGWESGAGSGGYAAGGGGGEGVRTERAAAEDDDDGGPDWFDDQIDVWEF